jgi:GNAT superfamily N-acetyltransferase
MNTIHIRPADLERDFGQVAAFFSTLEDEPSTETGLKGYYQEHNHRILQRVAEDEQGELLGFYWVIAVREDLEQAYLYLYVKPAQRRQGIGSQLYQHAARAVQHTSIKKLSVFIWDTCQDDRNFAIRRGFSEQAHNITMSLDLTDFDSLRYTALIARLEQAGFQFTSMEALGNAAEAKRKLYRLNNTTAMDEPGSSGKPAWETFEEFKDSVLDRVWYLPGGQIIAIDTTSGSWAAICAVTILEWHDHATILHLGVDAAYRDRDLDLAVMVLALRYARDVLRAKTVYTQSDSRNLPALELDRQLGCTQTRGSMLMSRAVAGQAD